MAQTVQAQVVQPIKLHHDWLLTEDEYPGRWLLFRSDGGMWGVCGVSAGVVLLTQIQSQKVPF